MSQTNASRLNKLAAPGNPAPEATSKDIYGLESPMSAQPLLDPPGSEAIVPRKRAPIRAKLPARPAPGSSLAPEPAATIAMAPIQKPEIREQEPAAAQVPAKPKLRRAPEAAVGSGPKSYSTDQSSLAARLELARAAREAAQGARAHAPEPTPAATARRQPSERATHPGEQGAPASAQNKQKLAPAAAKPVAKKPAAPQISAAQKAEMARNAIFGMALSYVEDFQSQIAGPLASLWKGKWELLGALSHVIIPLAMTLMFAHWNTAMEALFLESGVFSNLGKLCWLYAVSAFLWTLVYIGASRLWKSALNDGQRFERIGRGFMSPNNDQ